MILFIIAFLPAVFVSGEDDPVVACAYSPLFGLEPKDIDPFLCTHLIVDIDLKFIQNSWAAQVTEVMKLKRKNYQLQVLQSVYITQMDQLDKIRESLRVYPYDGIRIIISANLGRSNDSFMEFEQNLKKLKSMLSRGGYIILLEIYGNTDDLYSIPRWHTISENADLISLMWQENRDLYLLNSEDHLNIRFAVNYLVSKGVAKDRLLIGLPATGYLISIKKGEITNSEIMNPLKSYIYREICKLFKENPDWVEEWNQEASISMIKTRNGTLVYNSKRSFQERIKFVKIRKLRGVHLDSLSFHDLSGECGEDFPLISEAKKYFNLGPNDFFYVIQTKNEILSM